MLDDTTPTVSPSLEFVTFDSGGQNFCLEITQIREIRRWAPVTAIPHAPSDVLGVMNLRGAVIPIYDLAARFGFGSTSSAERNVVIIVNIHSKLVGLLVSAVSEILSVNADQIQVTPRVSDDTGPQAILGVISLEGSMIRVIDLKAVISDFAESQA